RYRPRRSARSEPDPNPSKRDSRLRPSLLSKRSKRGHHDRRRGAIDDQPKISETGSRQDRFGSEFLNCPTYPSVTPLRCPVYPYPRATPSYPFRSLFSSINEARLVQSSRTIQLNRSAVYHGSLTIP